MCISSSELALTGRYPPTTFTGLQNLAGLVASKSEELRGHDVDQYISVKHVTERDFGLIEKNRNQLSSVVRLSYFPDIGTLIIKVPSREHEKAHTNIGTYLAFKVCRMGVGIPEFQGLGATRYIGPTASTKECDASWTNDLVRPGGWPFLVIEAGLSESMPRLQADAAWWIANSSGQVKIVLLIKVMKSSKKIEIEKYVPAQVTALSTRSRTGAQPVFRPHKVAAIALNLGINPPTVQGAPLILEFRSVFGRAPNTPLEQDMVFTAAELLEWSRHVFI